MSKYTKFTNSLGASCIVNPDGVVVAIVGGITSQVMIDVLNMETAPLHAEIERLQAELKDARGFIRSIFPLENPSDIRYANQYMNEMIAKWEESEADNE